MNLGAPAVFVSNPGLSARAFLRLISRALGVEIGCAAWCFLTALATLRLEDVDDGFFLEVANLWAHGKLPYVAAFDVKAPGAYAIFAVAVALFGPTITVLKLCGAAAAAVASASLYRIVARLDRAAAIACAAAYPILMLIFADPVYQVMNAALLLGFRGVLSGGGSRSALARAGAALGFACLVKQTCVFDVLLCAVILLAEPPRVDRLKRVAALLAGAVVSPTICLLYFAHAGALAPLFYDTVEIASRRSPPEFLSAARIVALEYDVMLGGLFVPIGLLALRSVREQAPFPLWPIAAWLCVEQLSDILQGALWVTYMTPTIAPAMMLGSIAAGAYGRSARPRRPSAYLVFALGAVLYPLATHGYAILAHMPPVDHEMLDAVASTVAGARPAPNDKLLTLNGSALPNIVTRLDPPTPYIHFTHTMCNFPGAGLSATRADFEAKPRFIVYEHANSRLSCQKPDITSAIADGLRDYRRIREGRTPWGEFLIYERNVAERRPM